MRINSFRALRPDPSRVADVASVPYDTVSSDEARILAEGKPWSFLHVVRPEIDLPADTPSDADIVYEKAMDNLKKLRDESVLIREPVRSIYVYRQRMGAHVQSGVVACCHVEDYRNNIIRKHERTRRDKEDDRTRHVLTLKANTGPVFLTYRDVAEIDRYIEEAQKSEPVYSFTAEDGVDHVVWRIEDDGRLTDLFQSVPLAYVADGHHRSAAAARACTEMQEVTPGTDAAEHNWFLAVLFPASQLQILPYNRVVKDLNGLNVETFLEKVRDRVSLRQVDVPEPRGQAHASMYIAGSWYALSWDVPADGDPVSSLDVSVLKDAILEPILGIKDPRTDTRIGFIGGIRGIGELTRRVDDGSASVAFAMYPVTVNQMMAIADAGKIMPPKSTWFEPKLRSGLFVHTLDES